MKKILTILFCAVCLSMFCSDDAAEQAQDEQFVPEIAGKYIDDWGYQHVITGETWEWDGDVWHIKTGSNKADYLVALNDKNNNWQPGLYSRWDWTNYNGSLYYCTTIFDAVSIKEAEAAPRPADANPTADTCNSFSWTRLDPL